MSDTELLAKPNPEPVRRVEVFTGSGRRRAWSAEQKARIVAESYEDGASVCAVARRYGLTPQQLFGWRRKARQRAEDGACENGSVFVPVMVDAALSRAPTLRAACPDRPSVGVIEVVVGVAVIRIPLGIDAAPLVTVLRAVRMAT